MQSVLITLLQRLLLIIFNNNNMNLRDTIKEQTIEYYKLPKGAEVSKELIAKYMMNINVFDFAVQALSDSICNRCKFKHICPSNITHVRNGVGEYSEKVYECGGFQLCH